ncbi:glycerophosphodiester phosphodiesterase [Litchfieldia salsa]|uniref:Glycerophosphoryl diester phosphodiesterase n=1 Tax=Litchfieldia salsa TaxID=930152 RepID=A0A1H0TFZ3_9BACI|nr:glycerophosphodiester phosphodiesterase [Litchfieldia salsa]SDP52590.1 glycerophosphoryl diester phosphodiesterase [Litchfieldia salsa]
MKINHRVGLFLPLHRLLVVLFFIGALFYILQLIPVNKQRETTFNKSNETPLVIAHRGGAGIAPENTLYAFKMAERLGVDAIELDVRMSKDKELIVIHDETVDRTTDGTGLVSNLTLDQLKEFDAGYRLKMEKRGYPFRNRGIQIPTLEEVFQEIKHTSFVIEIKDTNPKVEKKVAKLIKKYKLKKKVIVGSFNDESIKRFANSTEGKVPIGTGAETLKFYVFLHKLHLDRIYPLKRNAVQIPVKAGHIDLATERLVNTMRERNIAIHYWTINDEKTMKELIKLNVDGIITDFPNKMLQLINKDVEEL